MAVPVVTVCGATAVPPWVLNVTVDDVSHLA